MLRRARLFFLAVLVVAAVLLATEFPISDLVHARAAAADVSSALAKVRSENRTLTQQVHDLKQGSTIEQIAHQEYGLVERGQRAIVVMPGGGSTGSDGDRSTGGATAPLGQTTIPKSDLVPSDAKLAQVGGGQVGKKGVGFWQRVVQRLEFWKAIP